MSPFKTFALLTALLLSSTLMMGCVYSTQPLTDAKTSQPDLRLLGTWEISDPEKPTEKYTLVVAHKANEQNILQVTGTNDEKKQETSDLFLTKVGSQYLASIGDDKKDEKKYVIFKYALSDDGKFKYSVMDVDFFRAALNNKELKGSEKKGETFTDVILSDTPENLRKFIEKHADKCFTKETPLDAKRIKQE